jgi:hypothetical protein
LAIFRGKPGRTVAMTLTRVEGETAPLPS